jgi:hypothetical protein
MKTPSAGACDNVERPFATSLGAVLIALFPPLIGVLSRRWRRA